MTRQSKLAAAVFGDSSEPSVPEWKRLQDEEATRRQASLATQRTARLGHQAADAAGKRAR